MHAVELQRALDKKDYTPRYELFDLQDGLPGIAQQEPVPAAALGIGGRIWFATNHGVAWMDPSSIRRNELAPPVLIQAVTADGRRYEATSSLQLPQRTTSLRIDYTANSLSVPGRVRFRYRLSGVDARWQDPGSRREAFYTNLGPGSYRFQVIASNNDGLWNEQGAMLDFNIAPTFYQTRWFAVFCVIAVAGVLWLLFMLRLRQVTTRMRERLHERLIERERIARELHDTLLQGLQGLILRLHAASEQLPEGARPREMIERALDRADQVLVEGRDRVRDLRATAAPSSDLAREFVAAAEELKQHHSAEFRFIAQGRERDFDPIVREEVSRIGREALSNAFKHAAAAHIELEMVFHRREFLLSIRDDGRGIDQDVLRAGYRQNHWGLTGMRERAAKIRGRLTVWSRIGTGTEIELRVPASMAYVGAADSAPLRLLRKVMEKASTANRD
jgi:signal transduction histidine kinase